MGLPDSLYLIALGCTLSGYGLSFGIVALLSEVISVLKKSKKYNPIEISDKAAGLFNSMFSLSFLTMPVMAGLINDSYGFKSACDVMSVISACFLFVFYFGMVYGK